MNISELPLQGAFEVTPETFTDERGWMSRIYDEKIFQDNIYEASGQVWEWKQDSHSHTKMKGILRGLFICLPPHLEGKLIRIIRGTMQWVIVDLRKNSDTYGKWHSVLLEESKHNALLVPRGFAHGCLSISDHVDLLLKSDNYFSASHGAGIKWNDEKLDVNWMLNGHQPQISERDANYGSFADFLKVYEKR